MPKKYKQISIGYDKAIRLNKTKWWENKTPLEIAQFQMIIAELSMPFSLFNEAVEEATGHSVFTHQLVTCFDDLCNNLFKGEKVPSFEEILKTVE